MVTTKKEKEFIEKIVELSKVMGYSLSHEDEQGGFIIEGYSDENIDWLRHAHSQGEI